jgi:hypothetical protein
MKAEFEYESKDLAEMALNRHKLFFPTPPGYYWESIVYYDGVKIMLLPLMKGEAEKEGTDA